MSAHTKRKELFWFYNSGTKNEKKKREEPVASFGFAYCLIRPFRSDKQLHLAAALFLKRGEKVSKKESYVYFHFVFARLFFVFFRAW